MTCKIFKILLSTVAAFLLLCFVSCSDDNSTNSKDSGINLLGKWILGSVKIMENSQVILDTNVSTQNYLITFNSDSTFSGQIYSYIGLLEPVSGKYSLKNSKLTLTSSWGIPSEYDISTDDNKLTLHSITVILSIKYDLTIKYYRQLI